MKCPFKKKTVIDNALSNKTIKEESFGDCNELNCMAYDEGVCKFIKYEVKHEP